MNTTSGKVERDGNKIANLNWSFTTPTLKCQVCGTVRQNGKLTHDPRFWVQSGTFAELVMGAKDCPWCAILRAAVFYCTESKSEDELMSNGYLDWGRDVYQPVWHVDGKAMEIELFVTGMEYRISGLGGMPVIRQVAADLGSQAALRTALGWLAMCENFHDTCQAGYAERIVPARLLFIGSLGEEVLKLVEMDEQVAWICLSHRWGGKIPECITLGRNYQAQLEGIAWDKLPKTFQDVVHFVRKLGYQYIWIDNIAIVQDDEEDWRRESSRMAEYYGGAVMTIAATGAENSDHGIFGNKPAAAVQLNMTGDMPATIHARKMLTHLLSSGWSKSKEDALPILNRGWIYQERLLSRRVLHFTREELQWECMESSICDCGAINTSDKDPKIEHTRSLQALKHSMTNGGQLLADTISDLLRRWMHVVEEYSGLQLSESDDKLPALSGLARQYMSLIHRPDIKYLAGLWYSGIIRLYNDSNLLRGLLWARTNNTPLCKRPPRWRAPTWSWTSIDGTVYYPWKDRIQIGTSVDYISDMFADTSPVTAGNTTGQVQGAHLSLRGPIVHAVLRYNTNHSKDKRAEIVYPYDNTLGKGLHHFWHDYASFDSSYAEHYIPDGSKIQLLRLYQVGGEERVVSLVLKEIEEDSSMYHRIGIAEERLRREVPVGKPLPGEKVNPWGHEWPRNKGQLKHITIL